ncbi:MAG: hypothetical protein U9O84_00730, partial [Chloroflexota bacterium]|nr:hypothetical protein [Chloroflexota bacterium]
NSGVAYEDWTAYKEAGEPVLNLFIELKNGYRASEAEVTGAVYKRIMESGGDTYTTSAAHDDLADMINFRVAVTLLPRGAFANYMSRRQAEGADLAHLKPPHINPSERVLSLLLARPKAVPRIKVRAEDKKVPA